MSNPRSSVLVIAVLLLGGLANAQTILRPTNATASNASDAYCASLSLAYDGDMSTSASCVVEIDVYGGDSLIAFWNGFSSGVPNPSSITLNVNTGITHSGTRTLANLHYTTDCGSTPTWHSIYSVVNQDRADQTDVISLPTSIDTSCVQVRLMMSVNTTSYAAVDDEVYEIWIEEN